MKLPQVEGVVTLVLGLLAVFFLDHFQALMSMSNTIYDIDINRKMSYTYL